MHVFSLSSLFLGQQQVEQIWKNHRVEREGGWLGSRDRVVVLQASLFGAHESLAIPVYTLTWLSPAALSAAYEEEQRRQMSNSIQSLGVGRKSKRIDDLSVVGLDRPSKMLLQLPVVETPLASNLHIDGVLVSLGCQNKIPQTGGLNIRYLFLIGGWKSQIKQSWFLVKVVFLACR